jgi:hypothetical protein
MAGYLMANVPVFFRERWIPFSISFNHQELL